MKDNNGEGLCVLVSSVCIGMPLCICIGMHFVCAVGGESGRMAGDPKLQIDKSRA